MNKSLTLCLITISLGGCVTGSYVKPSGDNTASLTITTKTTNTYNQHVRIYKDKDCSDYPGTLINLLQSKAIGNDTQESTETTIKSGEPVTISVFAGVPRDDSFWEMFFKGVERTASENRHCEAFASFVPEPGAKYHAIYKIDGSPCSLNIMKIENGQGKTVTNARANSACAVKAGEQHERQTRTKLLTN